MKSKGMFLHPLALSAVAAGEEAGKPFQVLKSGTWKHPRYGKVEISSADLKAFKANFDSRVLGIDVQINYEHFNSLAHGTKAAGWVRALELRNNDTELWATPEWTPEALRGIKDKEWRYSSAEINSRWEHPETGAVHSRVLLGVALTNVPFIKGMEKIAASEHTNDQHEENRPMKLNELQATLLSEHGINLSDLQARAAKVGGLEDQVKTLSASVVAGDRAVAEHKAKADELTKKLSEAEKAAHETKFAALVEKGMKEGKLTKAFAEGGFRKIFEGQGYAFAESMLAEMPKVVPVGDPIGHSGDGAPGAGGTKKFATPDLEVVAKAKELMTKDEKCSFSDAVSRTLGSDPDLAKRYASWQGEGTQASA